MDLMRKLKEQGWYLTEAGVQKLTTELQTEDVGKIIAAAMNYDLRVIGGGALPAKRDDSGTLPGRIVLQVQRLRNISAPKSNEESTAAPRLLQLELSDGQTTLQALELERIPTLNLNVPPGTKIYFYADTLQLLQGLLILRAAELKVLGGKVEALVEKWELARQMQKYARGNRRMSGSSGPPPWVAFGKRLDAHREALSQERNFKSLLAATEKDKGDKESKENDEFNAMRSEAIAEAAKAGSKKVFGGGGQTILDHNVKKILEKGYSEEEANQALHATNNNLERALYNLKRRGENKRFDSNVISSRDAAVGRQRGGGGGGGAASAKDEIVAAKPATNVSLFDFLTDKLPVTAEAPKPSARQQTQPNNNTVNSSNENAASKRFERMQTDASKTEHNDKGSGSGSGRGRFENNISASFAANRAGGTQRKGGEERSDRSQGNASRRGGRSGDIGYERSDNRPSAEGGERKSGSSQRGGRSARNKNAPNERKREQESAKPSGENYGKESRGRKDNNANRNNSKNGVANDKKNDSNDTGAMQKLVENTAKMRIDSKRETFGETSSGRRPQAAQQRPKQAHMATNQQQVSPVPSQNYMPAPAPAPHQQSQQAFATQLPNGYTYDSSKIIGFQSKETNEFAMNLLKSQGLSAGDLQMPTTTQQSQAQHMMATAPPPQNPGALLMNSPTYAPPLPPQLGPSPGDSWMWKIGDLCLARYWDDGNFYEAEVTAISDKTCVVLFLGYGNHEEVLKSDCLPITDGNHCPINNYQQMLNATSATNMQSLPLQQQQLQTHAFQRGNSRNAQRFRGERQMYVPPHKREN